MNRRGFLTGLVAFTASAPAIVRSASLMQVRGIVMADEWPVSMAQIVATSQAIANLEARNYFNLGAFIEFRNSKLVPIMSRRASA